MTMVIVQAVVLSGRYKTEALTSHWSETGSRHCKTPECTDANIEENLEQSLG